MSLESSISLRKELHRKNMEDRKRIIHNDETWEIISDDLSSLYSEANKILSRRIQTFSMVDIDQHHPSLKINKLDLFGDEHFQQKNISKLKKNNYTESFINTLDSVKCFSFIS